MQKQHTTSVKNGKMQKNKTSRTSLASASNYHKLLLKALGGVTVQTILSSFFFLTSAQAASFVTTLETTDDGRVTLEFEANDSNKDGIISEGELSGEIGAKILSEGVVETMFLESNEYELFHFDISENELQWAFGYSYSSYELIQIDDYSIYLNIQSSSDDFLEERLWEREIVEERASTPEASLTLGFITLGGLMLGSKRKTKG